VQWIRLIILLILSSNYHICQIIRGGKLSQFPWIFVNHECFTIENFPWISAASTNYTKHGTTSSYKQQACYVACGLLCYYLFNGYCIAIDLLDFPLPSHKPAVLQWLMSSTHDNHRQNCQFRILLFLLPQCTCKTWLF